MSRTKTTEPIVEETPVDDVRRVRRRISREAGGDIHKLVEESRRVAEQYRGKLGLKVVTAPKSRR